MNISQIQYFIEVARCLSFSEAARHLYITQPTLSRQITSIESELNMQLFFRSTKGLRLTPAGIVLYEEMLKVMEAYNHGIDKAGKASWGYQGTLKIGIINGLSMGDQLKKIMSYFGVNYPNVRIELHRYSFKTLLRKLYQGDIDLAITYDFHMDNHTDLDSRKLMEYHPAIVIPKMNPLSEKPHIDLKDMRDQELVIVEHDECAEGVQLIINLCESLGGFYPKLYFVESMEDVILWLESTEKCAILNYEHMLKDSDAVKLYSFTDDPVEHQIMLRWRRDNDNYALNLLVNYACF